MHRILVIDDTPEIAELLTFALRDRGYEVRAEGYTHAVNELALEHRADAVVLDCTSYDMSEALFDAVRNYPRHAGSCRLEPPLPQSTQSFADSKTLHRRASCECA